MSNTWTWELVEPRIGLAPAIAHCLSVMAEERFVIRPESLFDLEGNECPKRTSDEVQEALGVHGGTCIIWKEDDSIVLSADPTRRTIGFGPLHELQGSRDADLAFSLQKIFESLCLRVEPAYGFSSDEHRLESALTGEDLLHVLRTHLENVLHSRPPLVLYWMNYFAANYFRDTIEPLVNLIGIGHIEHSGCGVLVKLADAPWNGRVYRVGEKANDAV